MTAVKERELPDADDDFAQISSEFDTIDELRDSLKARVAEQFTFTQGTQARDLLIDKLLELVELPVPASLIEDEVHRHLEGENRLEDDEHRAEVSEASEKQFRTQILLDSYAEDLAVQVSQEELTQYIVQSAQQYGMAPQEFIQALDQGNQIPALVGEIARNKALALALGKVTVVDTKGATIDLAAFTAFADQQEAEEEVVDEAEEIVEEAEAADAAEKSAE